MLKKKTYPFPTQSDVNVAEVIRNTVREIFDEFYTPAIKGAIADLQEQANELNEELGNVRKLKQELEHILALNKALKAMYANNNR